VANALTNLVGIEIGERRDPQESLELAKREMAVAEAAAGPRSKLYVNALDDIASVDIVLSKPIDALNLSKSAFEIAEKEFPESEEFISAAHTLAYACDTMGDLACAVHANEAALAVARKSGASDQWPLIAALSSIYHVKEEQGDLAGAGSAIEEALALPSVLTLKTDGCPYLKSMQASTPFTRRTSPRPSPISTALRN